MKIYPILVGMPLIVGIVAGTYSANLINGYVWAAMMDARAAHKKNRAGAKA